LRVWLDAKNVLLFGMQTTPRYFVLGVAVGAVLGAAFVYVWRQIGQIQEVGGFVRMPALPEKAELASEKIPLHMSRAAAQRPEEGARARNRSIGRQRRGIA
jgi:hypothetical protein